MDVNANKKFDAECRDRAGAIVSKMTLEEKCSQTLYAARAIDRLGIPAYNWWNEALHGVARAGTATVFPQSIAMAATWDEDLIERVGDAISTEARAKYNMQSAEGDRDIYKGLTFWSPNVNIFRDPRWGRGHETFGEDPYLTSRLGVRFVEGLQGHDEHYLKAAACAKHFAVHSGPESLRHEFDAQVSKQDMYETYLPAFKACVQEGHVEAVMGAYNRTNGEPCCGSHTLLIDILRDEWGFTGHVVSDCWAINDFHAHHHITEDATHSAAMAMNNGCDLNCGNAFDYLGMAVEQGLVDEARLDEALVDLLACRIKLGVLDCKEATPYDDIAYTAVDSDEYRKLNLEVSAKTLVLLKNDGLLPLDLNQTHTIGVIGPNADSRRALVGNYEGTASRYVTVLEGIQDYVGDRARVLYSEGCHLFKDKMSGLGAGHERFSEAVAVARASDVVIMCLGLDANLEGEEGDASNEWNSGDKPNLDLPGLQEELLETVTAVGKPVILILISGSALAVTWASEHVPAIVQAFYPGAQGGMAIAQTLFGERNFEGHLPVTFYRSCDDLPDFTDYSMQGRTYRYMDAEPLYPFGYGLSYTRYAYSDLQSNVTDISDEGVDINVYVENAGRVAGTETTEVYIAARPTDPAALRVPHMQLRHIVRTTLGPEEKRHLTIHLPQEAFALYDNDGCHMLYAGEYTVYVGGQCPDHRSEVLTGNKCLSVTLKCGNTVEVAQ